MRHINYIIDSSYIGESISEISKKTGFSRTTVRKYLNKTDWNDEQKANIKKSVLDPYKEIIDEW